MKRWQQIFKLFAKLREGFLAGERDDSQPQVREELAISNKCHFIANLHLHVDKARPSRL